MGRVLAQLLLSSVATYKIGFPGWPDPNLDSVPVFWGVSSKKGACTSPLFHFGLVLRGGWPVREFASRECVIEVVPFGGPDPLGPSFYFLVFPSTYFSRLSRRGMALRA
jgi:hypothetical protein